MVKISARSVQNPTPSLAKHAGALGFDLGCGYLGLNYPLKSLSFNGLRDTTLGLSSRQLLMHERERDDE